MKLKEVVGTLVSRSFGSCRLEHTIKTNCMKLQTVDMTDMLNFDFLKKGLGQVCPPHFVHDFSGKILLMIYSIN